MTMELDDGWFKGPEIDTAGDLYKALVAAMYAVDPRIRHSSTHVRWVMNPDWYRRIRAQLGVRISDDNDDPDKWNPDPADRLLGLPVSVTDDGGAPHLENRCYPANWPEA